MKKITLICISLILGSAFLFFGCKKATEDKPCNNLGNICIENKLDSTITVDILQIHYQFQLQKDYMQCIDLAGDQSYSFKITAGPGTYTDTTFLILNCDKKLYIVQ
jgi:hypothetical protein